LFCLKREIRLIYLKQKSKMSKKLKRILSKKSGRNASGKVTVRHQGGREKRFLREIDFKRDKRDIPAKVISIEYDPNRMGRNVIFFLRKV